MFLSTVWNPVTTGTNYEDDNAALGTQWTYGFALNDANINNGGMGTLYAFSTIGNNVNARLSDEVYGSTHINFTYRNGQEVRVNTSNNLNNNVSTGNWMINSNPGTDSISFWIDDISGTALASSSGIALHWGMTCANDTIEGYASVPEPTTLALLGVGLLAIPFAWRRRRKVVLLN